jgi:hypothetical protein
VVSRSDFAHRSSIFDIQSKLCQTQGPNVLLHTSRLKSTPILTDTTLKTRHGHMYAHHLHKLADCSNTCPPHQHRGCRRLCPVHNLSLKACPWYRGNPQIFQVLGRIQLSLVPLDCDHFSKMHRTTFQVHKQQIPCTRESRKAHVSSTGSSHR